MKNYLRIGITIRNTKISQILDYGYKCTMAYLSEYHLVILNKLPTSKMWLS